MVLPAAALRKCRLSWSLLGWYLWGGKQGEAPGAPCRAPELVRRFLSTMELLTPWGLN